MDNIFVLPVLQQYLVYAPLHDFGALVDHRVVQRIHDGLLGLGVTGAGEVSKLVHFLRSGAMPAPVPKSGELAPAFLGLIPTRDCNLSCEYCGFVSAADANGAMDLALARDAVDWYLGLVCRSGAQSAEVHFFGGEPFCAPGVVEFAVHFARLRAASRDCSVRFEVATNGVFDEDRCRWVADSLDSVILSLDGPPDIQDQLRHHKDGRGTSETVSRSARILSQGPAKLSIRVCVIAETVESMPEIAAWLCREFRPVSICFEPLQPSQWSQAAGLRPPDPWAFSLRFIQAADILDAHGAEPVYAAADVRARRVTFCPVGQDVTIVSPDGSVGACYLLERDWAARGMDLRLGKVAGGSMSLDPEAVAAARGLNVWNRRQCARCFCKWHCAGGCHVNHLPSSAPGDYDRLCIQTRLIALRHILKAMQRDDLISSLLLSPKALERAALQASDGIIDMGREP
jgi:uncharacterized protein